MKKFTLFLILFFSIIGFSQSENLVDITWLCTNIVIEGNVIQAPNNAEVMYVTLQMTQDNDPYTEGFSSGVCNTLGSSDGTVTYNDLDITFTISDLGQTLITCGIPENEIFEISYFNFFYNSLNTHMPYEITNIGDVNALTITSSNGDTAN